MSGKWYRLLALLLILSLALVACGGDEEEPPAADTGEEPGVVEEPVMEEEPPVEEEVVDEELADLPEDVIGLHLMGWSSSEAENSRLQAVVDDFNAANDDVEVVLNLVPDYDTRLQTSLAGGSPPDVFYIDSFRLPDYVEAGALEPGEGRIDNPDDFYDSLYNAFVYDGTFYCPPKDFSTLGLIYNEDLFDAAGVEHPTEDWTWDDLQSAAEQLTNADEGVYGLSLSADFARLIAFLYQAGAGVANEDFTEMTINSPEALEATEFYVGLVLDGYAAQPADLDSGWPGEAFGRERAAMVVEGNWIVPFMEDQFPDVNFGIAQLPAGPGGEATMAFTVCYGVPAAIPAERQEAAFRLVNYLTGEEGMEAWTNLGLAMPTRESLRAQWLEQFPELQPFLDGADHARAWQFVPGFQDVLDTINNGLQQAFAGSMLPEQVLEEAEEVGTEVLNR
ncbi:MAG TPA: ABC transporter substrate-binding protein [Candidatus Sulfomarinibacteraceae bacterium]|nr:ABC transporter substrate-binding protein [Candidatus Sulfomarinibacteraceae bacterium]